MIKREIYKCETCGRYYDNPEACIKCEQKHVKPVSFGRCYYFSNRSIVNWDVKGTINNPLEETSTNPAPDRIQIKFSDGLYRSYILDGTGIGFKETKERKRKDE